MSEEARREAGIYEALQDRPAHTEKRGDEFVIIEHRIPEDDIREDFFVTESVSGADESESIVILCGDMHTQALKNKLEMLDHKVDMDESLVPDKRWV
jgi:hypothetical protein